MTDSKVIDKLINDFVEAIKKTPMFMIIDNDVEGQFKQQLLAYFRGIVPKRAEHEIRNGEYEDGMVDGINKCRDEILKRLGAEREG
jgi:hypothetical protein